ncbi:hypothetical protein BY453_1445 [Halanaerobium congolense]|uniref:Uncharacterized protein n=2 Tax=Halanaerobium congolense TaxID=54121 RepID=A0A4R7DUF9_9FIRM|nr:hypothetical protein BY453_1445 [Halanaerobium congolense]
MFPDCNEKSIKHSHTIQKNGGLKMIAEKNHVYRPVFSYEKSKITMKKTSINYASTFPGFCIEHESAFNSFEKNKEFKYDRDIKLQLFRSLCRELHEKNILLENNINKKNEYKNYQLDNFKKILAKYLRKMKLKKKFYKLMLDSKDFKILFMNNLIEDLNKDIESLSNNYFNPLFRDIEKEENNIYYQTVLIEHLVPVCLSGLASFKKDKSTTRNYFIFNIIPQENGTLFTIATNVKFKNILDNYITHYTQDPLLMLIAIETLMIHATDHWYIKPSVWDKIPENRRRKILNDILNSKKGLFTNYNISIFDQTREHILNILDKEDNWNQFDNKTKKFYFNERMKLMNKKSYDIFTLEDLEKASIEYINN